MINCGGCGRDIEPEDMDVGSKYLCSSCYHLQVVKEEPSRAYKYTAFIAVAAVSLTAIALAGLTLCILYFMGTGNLAWFIMLCLLMLCVMASPAVVLLKKRNVTLLITTLYLPLGIWSFLWYMAPGVDLEYSKSTAWGALFFAFIGLFALYLFIRDLRMLPRL